MRRLPVLLLCLPLACGDDPPTDNATSVAASDTGGEEGEEEEEGEAEEEGTSGGPGTTGDATGDPTGEPTTEPPDTTDTEGDTDPVGCSYPEGAVEPMTLAEVITPYTWPNSIHADGTMAPMDLADAPCGNDDAIPWSAFEVLLFISLPQW